VQTRLRKFEEDENMQGVIFAKAGLHRLDLLPANAVTLDWMLPAPAQGIIGIACREDDTEMIEALKQINHHETFIAGTVEREFLATLMGGCSVPISALAKISSDKIELKGALHSFDGRESYSVHEHIPLSDWEVAGKNTANKLLAQKGVNELLEIIRNKNWNEEGAVDQNA
jgi:hydroxymethylbilane synthase